MHSLTPPTGPGGSRALRLATWSLALVLFLIPAAVRAEVSTAPLRAQVNKNLPTKATLGVNITALGSAGASSSSAQTLFSHRAGAAMIPASNLKLLTTATALDFLGGDFHFSTRLFARRLADGTVEVAVVGDGDPSFGDAELFKAFETWGTRTVFERWARRLADAGITHIDRLVLDDSVFDEQTVQPNWPDNQRHLAYEAQISGLSLNINCVNVHLQRGSSDLMQYRLDPPTAFVHVENACRRGSKNAVWLSRAMGSNKIVLKGQTNASKQGPMQVTIDDPTGYFSAVMLETLAENGVTVADARRDRRIRAAVDGLSGSESRAQGDDPNGDAWDDLAGGSASGEPAASDAQDDRDSREPQAPQEPLDPTPWHLVAVHETPITTVLARTNKDSVNLYAESLAKRMAFEATGEPGSWKAAEQQVKHYLSSLGVDPSPVALDDGSGLSRLNRVTADAMSSVLAANFYSEDFDAFLASLSEAGADGTLRQRFRTSDRTHLRGRVFGKTGYINGVSTFSGYLHGRDGNWYAFSVLVNDCPRDKIWQAKLLQENLVLELDKQLPRRG